ncbi:MAG: DUF4783 domain-containing protein [Rubricoccaceae bacterium]
MSRTFPSARFARCRWLLLAACAVLAAAQPSAQIQADEALARAGQALEAGDANALLSGAAERIEVVIFEQGGRYRQAQAAHVLRDFFRRHPPERVAFSERSTSDEGRTAIGRYWTREGGTPLSVRLVHQQRGRGGEWQLVGIRIERPSMIRTGY